MTPQSSFNELLLLLQTYRKEMKSVPLVQKHIYATMHIYTVLLRCVCVCSGAGGGNSVEPERQP